MHLAGYFNKLQNYIADCKEYQRQVDRERNMICGGNIVLMDDFNKCFDIIRQNNKPSSYHKHMNRDMAEFFKGLVDMGQREQVTAFQIPLNCLKPETKQRTLDAYERGKESLDSFCEQSQKDLSAHEYELFASFEKPPTHMAGMRLGVLLDVADSMYDGLISCDRKEIWTGQGKTAVDFWKSMNALDDYSHLFPDHRPPGPGKKVKDKGKAKSPLWGWRPAFNN